jgi:hypothetical protein
MRIISLAVAAAFTVLSTVAFAQTDAPKQTETAKGNTGAYPLPQIDDGSPGLDVAGPDGSTKSVRPVPCSAAAQETDGSTTCVGIEAETKRRP